MLPPHLHDQIQYRTVVAPLFCYNYVERHCPHVVAKQFEVLDGVELQDVGSDMKTIKFKANRGNCSINFRDHYKKEVVQWDEIGSRLAENFQPAQQSTPEPEAAHQTPTFEVSPTNSPHLSEQVDTSEAENFQPAQQSTPEPEAAHQTPTFELEVTHHSPTPAHNATLEVTPTNSPHLSDGDVHSSPPSDHVMFDTSEGKIFNYVMFLVTG
ncbi:uncharacterized protein LOC123895837 [Trifolium pratense]|uniref:uncharacterized protein LOC123895837 n=1 Tax=Trifolium pratense TaxID=57577 RepID=UPI001E69712B|nr:uncharacterized protein LOC123895837 [Trifolium pratense]